MDLWSFQVAWPWAVECMTEHVGEFSFINAHNSLRLSLYTRALYSEIYETLIGMTTDVYPRENCIAPAIVFISMDHGHRENGRGLAPDCAPIVAIPPQKREASHTGGTQEGLDASRRSAKTLATIPLWLLRGGNQRWRV